MSRKKLKLNKILGTFTKVLSDLNSLVEENADIVAANTQVIDDLGDENVNLTKESDYAESVIKNINESILGK